jgi:hypothetical protein
MSNTPPVPQAPQAPQTAKPIDPKEGRYKAKAATPEAAGLPHEFGRSKNGNPELLVHLFLPELQRTYVTVLYFSKEAAPYSEERLRALGCADLTTLAGIDANEVDVELRYEWYDGSWRTRVQILSGGGVFHTSSPMQGGGKEFAAIVAATLGRPANLAGGDAVAGSNGAPKPPF